MLKLKRSKKNEPTTIDDVILALIGITMLVSSQVLLLLFISVILIKL